MSLKRKVEKLEGQARDIKPNRRTIELVLPWPGEPIKVMVTPEFMASIVRIYGPKSPADPTGERAMDAAA